jgi:hypothetical protein
VCLSGAGSGHRFAVSKRHTIEGMQAMRELLRTSLGRSLRTLSDEDRLVAAWPVACGATLAAHGEVVRLDGERVLHVRVLNPMWRDQFAQMRSMLTNDMRRIAGVRLEAIHFEGQAVLRTHARAGTGAGTRE